MNLETWLTNVQMFNIHVQNASYILTPSKVRGKRGQKSDSDHVLYDTVVLVVVPEQTSLQSHPIPNPELLSPIPTLPIHTVLTQIPMFPLVRIYLQVGYAEWSSRT